MTPQIRTLLPMAVDGVGPSHACTQLVEGFDLAEAPIDLLVNRIRTSVETDKVHAALPSLLAKIPYRLVAGPVSAALEKWYLNRLQDGDIAWLWPSVSLKTHELVAARGNPIVLEGINTRMAVAKEVLDAAYDAVGAAPGHGITQNRIDIEEQKLACANRIFAPSPAVEQALVGSPLEGRFLASSYGTDARTLPTPRTQRESETVTFLFCGSVVIRKGIHHLLDIWPQMPKGARLRIVGRIEPLIAERYADILNSENVETIDFTRNLAAIYVDSDIFVFPSLEEGDPLVTYKAGLYGLPIIASPAGAGRLGAETGCATLIEPGAPEPLLEALLAHYQSAELRTEQGKLARAQIAHYDWRTVGKRRAEIMNRTFPELGS